MDQRPNLPVPCVVLDALLVPRAKVNEGVEDALRADERPRKHAKDGGYRPAKELDQSRHGRKSPDDQKCPAIP